MTEEENLEAHLKQLEISAERLPSVAVLDDFLPLEMNPFQPRPRSRSTGSLCSCIKRAHQLNDSSKTIVKKQTKKLLREPVLKYASKYLLDEMALVNKRSKSLPINKLNKSTRTKSESSTSNEINTLLDSCERLHIDSNGPSKSNRNSTNNNNNNSSNSSSSNSSCSQEAIAAMNISPPCDVTMDELASYFETFVHIPKKMSSMAEMMYI